jgi:O-antigen/teichoic acid export membrane protein
LNLIPTFVHRRIAHRPNLVKIVDNIGWLFFDKVLRMGIGLVVGVWIARYLGPEQFGLLSFAIAFVGLFGAIATLGLQGIVVRDIVRDPDSKEKTLGTAAVLLFFGGLVSYGLILATIFWMRADDTLARAIVAILGSMVLFKASDVAVYWFESQVKSKYTVWVQNGVFLMFAGVKVGLILKSAPLIAFAWAMMVEAAVVGILLLVTLSLRGPHLRKLSVAAKRAKSLLVNSWPLMLSGLAVVIYMKIDQIMLGQMLGDQAVGIYSAAVRVSEVWYFVPVVIAASVFPSILEAKTRNDEHYYKRLQHLYDLMVWVALIVALPLTFLSTPIVTLLFGTEYVSSGPVLTLHVWSAVFVFLLVASGKWLIAENLQYLALQRNLAGLASNVILNLILIPGFGVIGAAWATVVSYSIAAFFADALSHKTRRTFFMKLRAFNLARGFYGILVLWNIGVRQWK